MASLSTEDTDLVTLDNQVHVALMPFTTSEWLEVVPTLLISVENLVKRLKPGVMIGEAYPRLWGNRSLEAPLPVLSPSQVSTPSSAAAPPSFSTPSTDSGATHPSPRVSDVGGATRPLPRSGHQWVGDTPPASVRFVILSRSRITASTSSSDAGATPPFSSAATIVPSASSSHPAVRSTAASATAPTVSSGRSTRKHSSTVVSPTPHPDGLPACSRCRQKWRCCDLPSGATPPFVACCHCLKDRATCDIGQAGKAGVLFLLLFLFLPDFSGSVPAPRRPRHHQKVPPIRMDSPIAPVHEESPPVLAFDQIKLPILVPPDSSDRLPIEPPPLLKRGSASAPFGELIAWCAEIYAATREHTSVATNHRIAHVALDSTISIYGGAKVDEWVAVHRIEVAERRYKLAWTRYHSLLGACPFFLLPCSFDFVLE